MSGGNSNPSTPTTGTGTPTATQPSWAGGPVSSSFDPKTFGSQIGGDIKTLYNQGPGALPTQLYAGLGDTTNSGLQGLLGMDNSAYTGGLQGAISDYADIAAGNRFGTNDPGYAALRAKAGDDTLSGINQLFSASGRFGGGSHVQDAAEGLGNTYAGLDYQNFQNDQTRQQNAATLLPQLYQSSLLPSQTKLGVGAVQDQDRQAQLDQSNQLLDLKNNQGLSYINQYLSTLGSGTQSGNVAAQTPLWQSLLGTAGTLGGGILGALL